MCPKRADYGAPGIYSVVTNSGIGTNHRIESDFLIIISSRFLVIGQELVWAAIGMVLIGHGAQFNYCFCYRYRCWSLAEAAAPQTLAAVQFRNRLPLLSLSSRHRVPS